MKTKLMTVFLAAASCGFAADQMPTTKELPLEVKSKMVDMQMTPSNWFGYMRMGLSDSRPNNLERVVPGLGLGFRFGLPVGAIDVSASYTGDNYFQKADKTYVFYTVPRVSYLYYISPAKDQSFYAGTGLAYGSLQSREGKTKFFGLLPSISLGYEMNRLQNWRSFVQMDVSTPAVTTATVNPTSWTWASLDQGPVAELSVGFGY